MPVEQENAGHAVWVTGVDPEPDGSYKILLNDSGTSLGQMSAIDYWDFYNAWQDAGCFVAVVDA
jgi:uncharacterized protein YfdQ (DUF2303 family)